MIVAVTGGRDFTDRGVVDLALELIWEAERGITELRHGDCRGADRLARDWAISRGVPALAFPAAWEMHGKMAGAIRNREMLDKLPPVDLLLAFPGGKGTAGCIAEARKRGIQVVHAALE